MMNKILKLSLCYNLDWSKTVFSVFELWMVMKCRDHSGFGLRGRVGWWWPTITDGFPSQHVDFIKWKHYPCYWSFVRGIQWSLVDSPQKRPVTRMFSLICAYTNGWANNQDAGDLGCHRAHYDVTVMKGPAMWKASPCPEVTMTCCQLLFVGGNVMVLTIHGKNMNMVYRAINPT